MDVFDWKYWLLFAMALFTAIGVLLLMIGYYPKATTTA